MTPSDLRSLLLLTSLAAIGAATVGGCASVDAGPDYDRTVAEIRSATGVAHVYHPEEAEELPEREAGLLAGGLELREAVELGLLRNPFLQASFRNVGMAKADRVQAGLLTNPSLIAALRFPTDGGKSQIEGGLFANLLDLWQIPERKRVAQSALERSVFEVAHAAVQLAGDIRGAYLDALAADQLLVIAEENRDSAKRLVELVAARLEAAAATSIDMSLAGLELLEAEVAVRDARLEAGEKRRNLAARLGYEVAPPGLRLSGSLPDPGEELPGVDALRSLAAQRRLDIRAARARLEEAVAELQRQHGLVVRWLQAGVSFEREGGWAVGPAVRLELPVFDQNQAQVAKAVEGLAQDEALLRAVQVTAAREVASASARTHAQWDAARLYGEQVRLAQEALDLSRQSYEAGQTTILPVIEAQRKLLSARHRLALRLRDAAVAVSDLERTTGAPREEFLEADGSPARQEP